ncbi:hypothetical protein CTAYLR_007772 [Chrysophaeum taylorii]|uniref:Uncharacterized protein n=1 Tax=Chrysophaeum taylorii TaxID=2483200 RepID=A0AAD7UM56_9STRA|nr:hypothetical protein CTAYLR_007772 [Chrysophaeum taylorii]
MKVSLVFGVGARRGLGGAIAAKLAAEKYHVVMVGRTKAKLEDTAESIVRDGGSASCIALESIGASSEFAVADTNDELLEREVIAAFDDAQGRGELDLVVQNQGPNMRPPTGTDMRDMTLGFTTYMWQNNFAISFLVGREAARRLVPPEDAPPKVPCGTLIFTGATASMRGKPPFVAFAAAKAGVRYLAQSMAREFGPRGLHVAHVVIDGIVAGERLENVAKAGAWPIDKDTIKARGLDIDAVAETFWHLHTQSPQSWTHELELRPFSENW